VVRAKLENYYTFKIVGREPLMVDCVKWDEMGEPLETYHINPNSFEARTSCSCPAYTWQCKHRKCVEQAMREGRMEELWKWKWDPKGGWQELDDMRQDF
jgi:hypothetical protein